MARWASDERRPKLHVTWRNSGRTLANAGASSSSISNLSRSVGGPSPRSRPSSASGASTPSRPRRSSASKSGTFAQAVALDTREPADTEEAQYSLPYSVAAALRRGTPRGREVAGAILNDERGRSASLSAVRLREVTEYSHQFPGRTAGRCRSSR